MGGRTVQPGIERLTKFGIPTYENPAKAVRAFLHLVSYGSNREILYEMPRELPVRFSLDRQAIRIISRETFARERMRLFPSRIARHYFRHMELPRQKCSLPGRGRRPWCPPNEIGLPVVLKVISPDVSHKTDVGGVRLDLGSDERGLHGVQQIITSVARAVSHARIEGVAVQEMITDSTGQELILGKKR